MKMINRITAIITVAIMVMTVVVMAKDLKKADIKVSGMTCNSCVESVKSALMKVEGVNSADVSLKDGKAVVEFDAEKADQTKLMAAITSAGFKAEDNKSNAKAGKSDKGGCCGDSKKSGCGSDKKDKSSGEKI